MRDSDRTGADRVGLSLIVCTYNRAALLDRLLESIARELTDDLDLEVIVVDNNCVDDTAAVVDRYRERLPTLRRVVETVQGLSFARNRGAAESTKPYLLYLDDETKLSEGYLKQAAIVLRRFRPDFFGGPTTPYFDRPVPSWFDSADEVRQLEQASGFTQTGGISGANFGIARAVIGRIGPFDTGRGMKGDVMAFGEDREMVERYRTMTPVPEQRVYYALELAVHNFIMPYKLERSYQLARAYRNSASREHIQIETGKRGLAKSSVYALGHIALLPVHSLRIMWNEGLTARGYYKWQHHVASLGGRIRGIWNTALGRPSA